MLRRYYITDSRSAGGIEALMRSVERNLDAGVDYIQVREKHLSARALADVVRRILRLPNPGGTRILVNERSDVALATGAAGVHLPSDSLTPSQVRPIAPAGFVVGVSTHTLEEARQADDEGASYILFGPVFAPLSKTYSLPARGLAELERVCRGTRVPVFALGGITEKNAADCERAGADGIAGITMFQRAED